MIARAASAAFSRTYNRYVLASIVALAADTGLFFALLRGHSSAMAASACGYVVGIAVHWLISTRFVFRDGMRTEGTDRVRQKGAFVLTALMGLAITMAIVGAAAHSGQDPRVAKLIAIFVSFQATYLARRAMIFRA